MKVIPTGLLAICLLVVTNPVQAENKPVIYIDTASRTTTLTTGDGDLTLRLSYAKGCVIDRLVVHGEELTGVRGVADSGFSTGDSVFTTAITVHGTHLDKSGNTLSIKPIVYGPKNFQIEEEWTFTLGSSEIRWKIDRRYLNDGFIDENYFPRWQFPSLNTWNGALLGNGGVAWNRFLDRPGDTYGVSAGEVTFWSRDRNSCLQVTPVELPGTYRTATFSHRPDGSYRASQSLADRKPLTREGLRRFNQSGAPVFAPLQIQTGLISNTLVLKALRYDQAFDRGTLTGLDEGSVSEILNTIGRYGVVDENLYGSNGWRTGWTVLQEPWLGLFGLAIDLPEFRSGFAKALEYARDEAMLPDGRVLPRWHHDSTDAMPGTFLPNGFYECVWGYMFDSQPAFAICVAEQFDLSGDLDWLRTFKEPCERALEFMLRRDADGDGLYEVAHQSHRNQKGCDWLDVVWASHEVSTINAFMHQALVRWAGLENLLGDAQTASRYRQLADRMQVAFNQSVNDGGFWNPEKECYVHWREADGSVYGDNLVSPVNFLAIGYGLCESKSRKEKILNNIEKLMQQEKLFIWPACFFPYPEGLGLSNVNYPWPNYENGDLFLAWAELGTRCYASDNPDIALKYIRNVIRQYEKDGLGHQRYTRVQQAGAGDDILANNIMAIVGLYRNLYGIRPQYNRLLLEPHLPAELEGTGLVYRLRGETYRIGLSKGRYSVTAGNHTLTSGDPFGVNPVSSGLEFFPLDSEKRGMTVVSQSPCNLEVVEWSPEQKHVNISAQKGTARVHMIVEGLTPGAKYSFSLEGKRGRRIMADSSGKLELDIRAGQEPVRLELL